MFIIASEMPFIKFSKLCIYVLKKQPKNNPLICGEKKYKYEV